MLRIHQDFGNVCFEKRTKKDKHIFVPTSIFPPANPLPGRGLVSPPLPFNEKSSSFLLLLRCLVENLEAERKEEEEEPTRGGWNFCPTPTVLLLHFKSTWERGRECVRIYNNTNKGPLDLFLFRRVWDFSGWVESGSSACPTQTLFCAKSGQRVQSLLPCETKT